VRLNALEEAYAHHALIAHRGSILLSIVLYFTTFTLGSPSTWMFFLWAINAMLLLLNTVHIRAYGLTFGVIPTAAAALVPLVATTWAATASVATAAAGTASGTASGAASADAAAATAAAAAVHACLTVLLVVALIACMIFACYLALFIFAAYVPKDRSDRRGQTRVYAVLGHSSLTCNPTDELICRLNTALAIFERNSAARFVLSGGKTWQEDISEAELMANYLQKHGVPRSSLILEDASTTTQENLANIKHIVDAQFPNATLHIITSNFHEYRSCAIARALGMTAYPEAAPTPPLRLVQDWLREVLLVQTMQCKAYARRT
jgi:uncharacterized SAM-binding protein YcdF (DUF218 family)